MTKAELLVFEKALSEFYKKIQSARNKILSHNDLEAILNKSTLGAYPAGDDKKYFNDLECFVNLVSVKSTGVPFYFSTDVEVYTEWLVQKLAG